MATPIETVEMVADVEAKFDNEPKEDKSQPEDAVFVEDTGDGTTTLMKPVKPTMHHRGHNINFQDLDSFETDDTHTDEDIKYIQWNIASALLFTIASILYLAMACMVMDYYWFYRDVPRAVYYADDDATWWDYFVNGTDDGFFPEEVLNATDDYTWSEWYNTSAFAEDDIVWYSGMRDPSAPESDAYISKYMILYFWASLGFVFAGIIDSYLVRKLDLWIRAIYWLMIVAALFGFVSAIITSLDPFWSNVCNCISVNLWALESIVIVLARVKGHEAFSDSTGYDKRVKTWFWVSDISFMIGTWGDAISSYWYVLEKDNHVVGILAIVFAFFWLLCALIYLVVGICDYKEYMYYKKMEQEYQNELSQLNVSEKETESEMQPGDGKAGIEPIDLPVERAP